jgi:hypothetical protein
MTIRKFKRHIVWRKRRATDAKASPQTGRSATRTGLSVGLDGRPFAGLIGPFGLRGADQALARRPGKVI